MTSAHLEQVLKTCAQPATTITADTHPFDKYLDLTLQPKSPEWLIDHVIQVGVVTLAGTRGIGKTTSVLPIAAAVAHLCPNEYDLRPALRRHVIWITEDPGQVERVLSALVRHAGWCTPEEVRKWFHVVEAHRMPAARIGEVAQAYANRFSLNWTGRHGNLLVRPLVVLDTSNACIELQNESDNAEVGEAMGALKTAFAGFPVLIIHHLAKSLNQRDDAESLTVRGAGAWEADAHQCLYLVKSRGAAGAEERVLVLGKKRFETDIECLRFESHVYKERVQTLDGEEDIQLRYSLAKRVGFKERQESRESQARDAHEARKLETSRLVESAWSRGQPVNRSQLRALMKGNASAAGQVIQELLRDSHLVEVPVPAYMRTNAAKSSFLIALNMEERGVFLTTKKLPSTKTNIPASYSRANLSS
jgi:hypothetical protein